MCFYKISPPHPRNFELLGVPLGSPEHCGQNLQARLEKKVFPTLDSLSELPDPQVALRLLRHCLSFGKVVYAARTTPPDFHETQLQQHFDEKVHSTFSSFTGLKLQEDQWPLHGTSGRQTAHARVAPSAASQAFPVPAAQRS